MPGDGRGKAELPVWVTLANAAGAAAVASWLTNPLDLAKLRLQVGRGTWDCCFASVSWVGRRGAKTIPSTSAASARENCATEGLNSTEELNTSLDRRQVRPCRNGTTTNHSASPRAANCCRYSEGRPPPHGQGQDQGHLPPLPSSIAV